MTPTLPFEILELIFANESLEPADAVSCCLVSQIWRAAALEQVYRNISFAQYWTPKQIEAFLYTLRSTNYGHLTRSLLLGVDALAEDSDLSDKNSLLEILRKMPGLQTLRISNHALKLAPKIKGLLDNVQVLEVDYLTDARPSRIKHFATALPSLTKLSIHVLPSRKQVSCPTSTVPCLRQLEILEIKQDEGVSYAPFEYFLKSFPNRKQTDIYAVWMARGSMQNPSLDRVDLSYVKGLTLVCMARDQLIPLITKSLTNCTDLCLHSYSADPSWSLLDRMVSLKLLPPNVQILEMHAGGRMRVDLPKSLLNIRTALPKVGKIVLNSRYRDDLDQTLEKTFAALKPPIELEWLEPWQESTQRRQMRRR